MFLYREKYKSINMHNYQSCAAGIRYILTILAASDNAIFHSLHSGQKSLAFRGIG